MREILTRYGDRKLGFLLVIVEALAHVSIFAILKHMVGLPGPDGVNVILFLVSGIVPFFYFRDVVSKLTTALSANKALMTLHQISYLDFFIARFLLETATSILTLVIAISISIAFVNYSAIYYLNDFSVNSYLTIMKGYALLGLLGVGLGLVISAISTVFSSITIFTNAIIRLLYLTSGALVSIKSIPHEFHYILAWNPLVYCMEILHIGFFEQYHAYDIFIDATYPLITGIILLFLGLILISRVKNIVLR